MLKSVIRMPEWPCNSNRNIFCNCVHLFTIVPVTKSPINCSSIWSRRDKQCHNSLHLHNLWAGDSVRFS